MTVRYGLEGRTVLITGAAGGIGQALSRAFLAQGARLMLLDREAAPLDTLVESLHSRQVHSAVCDLGDDAAVNEAAARVANRFGRLDVLVHNAGSEYPTPVDEASDDANARWAALLDNNVSGMWRLTRALLPHLPRGASVIHQSSIWGRIGVAGFSAYSASKHAIVGLTRSLALELGPRGIRVNAVCPGWVRTAAAMRSLAVMAREQGRSEAEVEREILSRQAVPVMLTPEDLADTFLFLASDGSAALTGQCLCPSHGEVML
ncbi:SDR family NAD(P)-dependent oxidoreductase [Hydrogenophaga pseudoflava]|uniref:SDR family NAD(P)-dependent oxidoreductase n=1 Tax=Hydrogenophaga pseudoflava TaxID=47421 RepID=UPI0027E3B3AE|nr:SDR family oxidoreductase [Hydrogenophaga pseudoflava]MDQ7746241.1 SDR family oxidoreductase [Hydrogenophaga pseudoflava]